MEKTWRWFGKKDSISLQTIKQIGVESIVTSLYDIPNGEIWSVENINKVKTYIEHQGLRWSVVESLPVSEAIKYGGIDRDKLIENYKISLKNLGEIGIKTVCYNFMPVIDWVRTELNYPLADGSSSLYFSWVHLAYFDIHILCRKNATKDYTENILNQVSRLEKTITAAEKEKLIDTIIVKTQGFISGNFKNSEQNPVEVFRHLLTFYDNINKEQLRENLKYFLKAVMPVCDTYNINLCIHPDDPPFQVLGLPRIVTSEQDIDWILRAVKNPHNGLTFCAGSLSAGTHNDLPKMADKFALHTHFAHLRSTTILENGDFLEASHLEGRAKLIDVIRIFEKENPNIPMRIDHGRLLAEDIDKGYNPGYSFHGRMLAFAQVEGIMAVVKNELKL